MPILAQQSDIFPADLFDWPDLGTEPDRRWWAVYTLSRREKELARRLAALEVPHYCPTIPQRKRSPAGRMRTSFLPLFTNYVFLYGNDEHRYQALTTNCVASSIEVDDGQRLSSELRQIHHLIEAGIPLTRESRLQAGRRVRVRTGPFRDYEGYIVRREGQTRLLVAVDFLRQGASLQLDDCEVEPI